MTNSFDAAMFILLAGLGFFLMLYSFKAQSGKGFMKMISMALFAILAIFIGSGYQVEFDSSVTNKATNETWNETDVLIDGGESNSWVAWLFSGFAMVNILFLLKDYQGGL